MKIVKLGNVSLSHNRLTELIKLADQAKPFYDWFEKICQKSVKSKESLNEILLTCSEAQLTECFTICYKTEINVPLLFDGIGRSYPHKKACFYFLSWILRDAPQQRLSPLIRRIALNLKIASQESEIKSLVAIAVTYRSEIGNFKWDAVREVIIDRLEGSRRSIKGHEREAVVRSAFASAIQSYFAKHQNYGKYSRVDLSAGQVKVGVETFDVCIELKDAAGKLAKRILVPVKTRETEGGGHAHLFTRDIKQAILNARKFSKDDFIAAVIIAENWAEKDSKDIIGIVDMAIVLSVNPNILEILNPENQKTITHFIEMVLTNKVIPKK